MHTSVLEFHKMDKYDWKTPSFWLNLNSLVICLSKTRKNSLEAMKNNINNKQV